MELNKLIQLQLVSKEIRHSAPWSRSEVAGHVDDLRCDISPRRVIIIGNGPDPDHST